MEPGKHKFWNSIHNKGQLALLAIRGSNQLSTSAESTTTEKYLFAANYPQNLITAVSTHVRPPEGFEKWLDLLQPKDPGRELAHMNVGAAHLFAEIQAVFDETSQDQAWLIRMLGCIRQGILVDAEFDTWADGRTSGIWAQKEVRSKDKGRSAFPRYVYHDMFISFAWNLYYAIRLHLNELLRRCVDLVQSHSFVMDNNKQQIVAKHDRENECSYAPLDYANILEEATETVSMLVQGICANIAFCLGEIDDLGNEPGRRTPLAGRLALWPMHVARCSCEEGSKTEMWLVSKLEFIGEVLGNKLAGRLAKRPRTEPWIIK